MGNKKLIEKTNQIIGEIYEELEGFGLVRYEDYSNAQKSTDEWKQMSKKFEKVFANFRKLMSETLENGFIDIKNKKPKMGQLVIAKLKDGTERKCFRCGCKDDLHNGWAEPIMGKGINIDVVGWKYVED